MKFEQPKLNKEKTDWDYARAVRKLMGQGLSFDAACTQVIKEVPTNMQPGFYPRMGRICGEISGAARKKMKPEKTIEKPQPVLSQTEDPKEVEPKPKPLFPELETRNKLAKELEEFDRGKKGSRGKKKKQAA